jgi:hypothetical protein
LGKFQKPGQEQDRTEQQEKNRIRTQTNDRYKRTGTGEMRDGKERDTLTAIPFLVDLP